MHQTMVYALLKKKNIIKNKCENLKLKILHNFFFFYKNVLFFHKNLPQKIKPGSTLVIYGRGVGVEGLCMHFFLLIIYNSSQY